MMHRLVGSVVLSGMVLLGAAACSGQGNDSSASSHGSSGAGGNDGGGAGGGGGVCQEANEVFGFKLTTSDGVPHACSELMDGDVTLEGVITASMPPSSYTIDSCQPGGGCSPMLNTLEVNSKALALAIPVGTLVSVSTHIVHLGGVCDATLFVKNVPLWGGKPNPTSSDDAPWLDSGGPGSPFKSSTKVRCTYGGGGAPPCTGGTSVYDLSFALATDPSVSSGPVMSGTTVTWDVPSSPAKGRYAVRNVRANSGYCEIPGTVEYFIARDPAP